MCCAHSLNGRAWCRQIEKIYLLCLSALGSVGGWVCAAHSMGLGEMEWTIEKSEVNFPPEQNLIDTAGKQNLVHACA